MASIEPANRAVSKADARRSTIPSRLIRVLPAMSLFLCLVVVQAFFPKAAVGQDSAGEYELKAAMLYNLTRFVDWPPSAYTDAQAPTVLCILGRDPFGKSLTSIASEQAANGARPVEIRHVANDKSIRGCHVVYISSSERKTIAQVLSTLKGSSVLTVGEMGQFAVHGGMIQFSLEERQVRFEINLDAASRADLKISSRLLVLARVVKEQNKNGSNEGSQLRSIEFEIADASQLNRQSGLEQNAEEVTTSSNTGDRGGRSR